MLALCLRAVLLSSPGTWDWTRMHALVVMHRRTKCGPCLNKGAFLYDRYRYFTRGIDALYRHTLYRYIDPYRLIVTPLVTIAASCVWAFSTLRKLSWMVHVLLVGTWPSRSCIIDSAVSNMAESLCHCRDPAFVLASRAALCPVESEMIWGSQWGPLERAGTSAERGTPPVSFGAPPDVQMSIAALEGGLSLSLRGWRPGCMTPFQCGSVVRARPRDDGYAFTGRR